METILIAGPTASGKSALAVNLATRLGGRIINADSMQVYRDLSILTARPTATDMARAPHTLYGTIDGAKNYSVSLWLAAAQIEIAKTRDDGRLPILVGGTGLYFKALTEGLSEIPPVSDETRREVRDWAKERTPEVLHAELNRRDPETAARLRPTDPQRILRALEVHIETGSGLSSFQARRAPPALVPETTLAVSLMTDRDVLRARVDQRFDEMITGGAADEVANLAARGLDPALPVMRAIGVPPLLQYIGGMIQLDKAIVAAKTTTRQYIKRQETFARHQLPTFHPVMATEAERFIMRAFQSLE